MGYVPSDARDKDKTFGHVDLECGRTTWIELGGGSSSRG